MTNLQTGPVQAKGAGATVAPLSEEQISRQLRAKDQFGDFTKVAVYESVTDPGTGKAEGLIHFMNPHDPASLVISIPTRASEQDVSKILQAISPTREMCEMLMGISERYQLGLPMLIEGETAIGKTFAVTKFTELLYGKGVKPLDFYCSGQTDVGDLIGKWVPAEGASSETQARWKAFIESPQGQKRLSEIDAGIKNTGDGVSAEDKAKMYQAQLSGLAKEAGLGVDTTGFVFQLGAIPKAFTGECVDGRFRVREGAEGFICHIQEAGLAKPAVLNSLLRIRGEQGKLADSIQLFEDGGRTVNRGPRSFIIFTNNPVDGYLDRKPVDPALSRGLEWMRFGAASDDSIKMTARKIFTYQLGNDAGPASRGASLDVRTAPELGAAIAETMVAIHQTMDKHFNVGESDDPQRNPVVMDNMFKVAEYINNFQVRNKDVGIDMGQTLFRAISRTYLERARPEDRPALEKLVQDRIFGTTGAVVFEGKTVPVAQKLDALAARARTAIEKESGLEVGSADALAAAVGEKQRGGFAGKLKGLLG